MERPFLHLLRADQRDEDHGELQSSPGHGRPEVMKRRDEQEPELEDVREKEQHGAVAAQLEQHEPDDPERIQDDGDRALRAGPA